MKKTCSQRKHSEAASPVQIQGKEKGLSESEKASLRLSLYSLTISNFHSTLNTLASIVLVANSALAFAAISRGWIELFSLGTGIYALSLVLYTFAACSNFVAKNTVRNITLNNEEDILKIINCIDKKYKDYTLFISISIIISMLCLFFVEFNIVK